VCSALRFNAKRLVPWVPWSEVNSSRKIATVTTPTSSETIMASPFEEDFQHRRKHRTISATYRESSASPAGVLNSLERHACQTLRGSGSEMLRARRIPGHSDRKERLETRRIPCGLARWPGSVPSAVHP